MRIVNEKDRIIFESLHLILESVIDRKEMDFRKTMDLYLDIKDILQKILGNDANKD